MHQSMSCLGLQANSLKSSQDEDKRSFYVCTNVLIPHHIVLLMGKRGCRKETEVHQGLANINLETHGWAVMRALRQQASPSCSCHLWAGQAHQPTLAPGALTMTRHVSSILDLPPNYFPRRGQGGERKDRR